MLKKVLILIIVFYFLTLLQTSFLVYFKIGSLVPNLVLISVVFISLFSESKNSTGYFSAFVGGLFLDIFSEGFIGFWILILLGIVLFIKLVLRQYVYIPILIKA